MELQYEITRRDLRAMNRHVQFGSFGGVVWRSLVVVSLLMVPLMVAYIVRLYLAGDAPPWQLIFPFAFLMAAALVVNEIFRRIALGPHRLQVVAHGVVEHKQGKEPKLYTWDRITKVDRTAAHVFIFIGILCIVVPTRAMAGEDEVTRFCDLVKPLRAP